MGKIATTNTIIEKYNPFPIVGLLVYVTLLLHFSKCFEKYLL